MSAPFGTRWCWIVLALVSTVGTLRLAAQSADPVRLEPQDDPALEDGQVAIVEGETGTEGVRYVLSQLSILQPVAVTLLSRETNPTLEILLHSPGWKDTVRAAALDGDVKRTFKFRTQGEVGITVRSPDDRRQRFDLVAWVGSEVEPEMEEVVVTPEEYRKYAAGGGGAGTSPILIVIAAALCGILVLLGFLVFRRVRS